MTQKEQVAKAKEILRREGYFVDNLWHIDDIQYRYNCDDDEQAHALLNNALTNEATMEQIWFAIDMAAQDDGLTLITED
jgi:hypothetical protein